MTQLPEGKNRNGGKCNRGRDPVFPYPSADDDA